jgi:hypothetical protein
MSQMGSFVPDRHGDHGRGMSLHPHKTMPRDRAYDLMRNALNAVLPSVETFARTAKSSPAKKNLMMQIEQIKEALKAAEQAAQLSPRLKHHV